MSLKVKDIAEIMEKYAPLSLQENYDNVGLMVGDPDCDVTCILIALDCTMDVIEEAELKKCNLILSHHPLLFRKPDRITSETLCGRKIIELIKNDINVYSSHTNLDSVKNGLNDIIMRLLGFNNYSIIEPSNCGSVEIAGIGRISDIPEVSLEELCLKVKSSLNISHLRYVGDDNMKINKVAVINGSGEDYFKASLELGADCIVTGDTTYHYVSDLCEEKVAVIDAGHFETEWLSFIAVSKMLQNELIKLGYSNSVIISEKSKSPYKYK